MENFNGIIETTIGSFDFAYCLIVNVLTYILIKIADEYNAYNGKKKTPTYVKRIMLLICILLTGVVYYITGQDVKLLFNSAILSTVSWDLVFKPICKAIGIDYKDVDKLMKK